MVSEFLRNGTRILGDSEPCCEFPAERGQVLRGYFEPNEDERERKLKQPTAAHRAIANLVLKGYFRLIVTTNFDRLLEQALADVGVQPVVISTADAVRGALPLAHSRCTLVKINGDYLDTRLRNTRDELERYEAPLDQLLDQIFDEYGLIVCGWSTDWDTALRAAMERCANHRFTTYWSARRPPTGSALDPVNLRRAVGVSIVDADRFFGERAEDPSALDSFSEVDPLSPKIAVAKLKKYLGCQPGFSGGEPWIRCGKASGPRRLGRRLRGSIGARRWA
jgi:hypothetical protein